MDNSHVLMDTWSLTGQKSQQAGIGAINSGCSGVRLTWASVPALLLTGCVTTCGRLLQGLGRWCVMSI